MTEILTTKVMRESDAAAISGGVPGKELMGRAAAAVFEEGESAGIWRSPVCVVCGSGNNAGDGYALAGILCEKGYECDVILLGDRFSSDGRYYFDLLENGKAGVITWKTGMDLKRYASVADCIFGTGFRGRPEGTEAEAIAAINESGAAVVSVDINSGLGGDSGMAELCVESDLTVSVGSYKPGHFLGMAKDVMKRKVNRDIGIAPRGRSIRLIEKADVRAVLPERKNNSNKGTYGYSAIIGGCLEYSGAVRLAAMADAAMRSGAGVVKVAVPGSLGRLLVPHILESTLFPMPDEGGRMRFDEGSLTALTKNTKSCAFGMGIGSSPEGAGKILGWLLRNYGGRLLVDADGLTMLAALDDSRIRERSCSLVITPHVKEFSRLTGLDISEILSDPVRHAEEYARKTGAVVLLKGPSTVITDGADTYICDRGCPGMATAGSGDVLSGISCALLGYCADELSAMWAAAYINGFAGEIAQSLVGSISMTASDTVRALPSAIMLIRGDKGGTV
ncbi:MAG: NAD(P)H-hydrate dehydratase [Clostridia bacterium]|nr:NAD(P)H-hydrate dehydratase [Clostridia bacterium]